MQGSYSKEKQIYSLSFSANSAGGLSFAASGSTTAMQAMQDFISTVAQQFLADSIVQSYIGSNWTQVWGPIVWANETETKTVHADNTMGCYYSFDLNLFVIAIAGTNPNSPYGWIDEDFAVGKKVSWESVTGVANSGSISQGTLTGLNVLLSMKDPNHDNNDVLTAINNYATKHSLINAEVAVAGHSLGGALSPTLALYMTDIAPVWDAGGHITTISAYPTAGPTPGDQSFAAYYESQIRAGNIDYLSQYNPLDVVPKAWQQSTLAAIPSIYDAYIIPPTGSNPENTMLGALAAGLALHSYFKGDNYTQIQPWTELVNPPAQFDTIADDLIKYLVLPASKKNELPAILQPYFDYFQNFVRFAAQAIHQHTKAYRVLVQVTDCMDEFDKIVNADKPGNALTINLINEVVKHSTGINLDFPDEKH